MKTFLSLFRYFLTLTFLASAGHALAVINTVDFQASGWRFESEGVGSNGRIRHTSGCCPRESYTGELNVSTSSKKNWSAVGRSVKYPAGLSAAGGSATLWAKQPVFLHMEVIDPASWTYIAVTRSWQFPGNKFGVGSAVNFPSFILPAKSVYYRVALMGYSDPAAPSSKQSLDVDQMTFIAL